MEEPFVTRGFSGKRRNPDKADRIPPGQYETHDFPVLSAGPTPKVRLDRWELKLEGLVEEPVTLSWEDFMECPAQTYKVDIHCVTKWSKLDTLWEGVSVDDLLSQVRLKPEAKYALIFCYGGYTTNLPLEDLCDNKAFMAYRYGGFPLAPEHGGPVRLVVPHLYFWKSAKWVQGIRFLSEDEAGFWERAGYHMYGDPWKEERYRE
ncbi:MAG: sulfite oxidase-like oxidoreductase [Bacteroidota bacterium]